MVKISQFLKSPLNCYPLCSLLNAQGDWFHWNVKFIFMNMLNLIKFEVLNSLLLALKPKPQTELNRNIASQKPV